ncbi:MAG: SCP2 sterol-binding domain-containing protein [Thermodesulfovibrionales bacterium]
MYKFLSEEWIKAYMDEWNKNDDLKKDLADFSASIKYYIEGSSEGVHLIIDKGIAKQAGKANQSEYDFELWASLKNWRKLATGDMGPRAAMLTKRLKFKGSMITAMKYMTSFEGSLKMMSQIPTVWDEES